MLNSQIPSDALEQDTILIFTYGDQYVDSREYIKPVPSINITAGENKTQPVNITGCNPGHIILGVNSSSSEIIE